MPTVLILSAHKFPLPFWCNFGVVMMQAWGRLHRAVFDWFCGHILDCIGQQCRFCDRFMVQHGTRFCKTTNEQGFGVLWQSIEVTYHFLFSNNLGSIVCSMKQVWFVEQFMHIVSRTKHCGKVLNQRKKVQAIQSLGFVNLQKFHFVIT